MSTTVTPALLTAEDLSEIVALSWSTLTSLVADPVPVPAEQHGDAADRVTASIAIGGAWVGTVVLGCPRSLATLAAAGMFDVAVTDLDERDVLDAMGEIANVVGGSVKGVVSSLGDCTLSLPIVSVGAQVVPGSHAVVRVSFACAGTPWSCDVRTHE